MSEIKHEDDIFTHILYDNIEDTKLSGIGIHLFKEKYIALVNGSLKKNNATLFTGFVSDKAKESNPLARYATGRQTINSFSKGVVIIGKDDTAEDENKIILRQADIQDASENVAFADTFYEWVKPFTLEDGTFLVAKSKIDKNELSVLKVDGPLYYAFLLVSCRYSELSEKAKTDEDSLRKLLELGFVFPFENKAVKRAHEDSHFGSWTAELSSSKNLVERIKALKNIH